MNLIRFRIALQFYHASSAREVLRLLKREKIDIVYSEFLKSGINLITNLKKFYLSADVTSPLRILGSIFPEKLVLEENKSRTPKINEAVLLLLGTVKGIN